MELPRFGENSDQFGKVDVGVASQQNLELGRRMVERENQLKRQQSADTSPLEKAAGALQTVRLMGSALTQAINSLPTRIAKGDAAAEKFIEERMYKPEQPLAYEYAGDVGEFLDRLETQYKLPPILPEAVALQYLSAPATSQAMRTAGRGAEQAGRAIERRMEPVVRGALEQGGLPREMVMAMGANTQSNVIKPSSRVVAPQMEALRLAQERAALPIEKGGLGLPPNNTAEQRAVAMDFDSDTYHGTFRDIQRLDPSSGSTESHAGRGIYSTDVPEDAGQNYASIYGPDVSVRVERGMEERDKDFRKIHGRMRDQELTPRQQEIILQNTIGADNLGVVYPLRVRSDKSIHLDAPEEKPIRIGPFEKYDEAADAYVDTPHTATFNEALDEFRELGGEANPIYDLVQDYGDASVPARDVFNVVKKTGNESGLYDPDTGDIVSGGVAAGDFVKHFGIDEIRHTPQFRNRELNIGTEHTISLDPDNVRSRFAAFDPFRRSTAIAAAMGVAAPDLLAEEKKSKNKKADGGKVSISNNPDTMMLELGNKRMKEGGSEDDTKPYFGGAGTKKYAPAKKRAEDADVNLLKDPRTYATVAGFMGERPDEMGFSVLHPDYQGVREAADPAFYAGTALGIAPLGKALNAPFAAIGKALDPAVGRFVTKTMERGGLGADILTDMGQGTRSYVHLPHTEKSPDPTVGTRYKRTDIGGLVPRKDLDIEKLDKSSVKVFPWDASDRNKLVTEVSDIPLTKPVLLEGGDNYMRDIKHVKKRIAGASNEGIANRIQDRIDQASVENQILGGTGKVFGFPIRMADKAEHASTFPTDIAMDLLKQGNLSRKELDDLTNELRGMSFEAKGKGYFQNVAPIDSPEFLVQLREGIKGNKEKGITSVTDMNLRRALMDRLSQKKFQKRLEYNYPDLIGSVIADELKGVPKGWVGNVSAELDPFSKIRPSKSSTYSHDFGGKYYASMPNMPVEFLTPNTYEGIYREMKSLYPSAKPEALRNMTIGAMEKRKEKISEMIGPRSIDAVKLYQEGLKQGEFDPNDIKQIYDYMRRKKFQLKLKDGGTVKKPAGAVKQPAAYIDGNEFVEAAQKYGIRDSMNNLNMIVNLVNKGLTVDDAARQVSDSGMHKAEGGAVSGDDLILEERPL
jgi:hypothetical protein